MEQSLTHILRQLALSILSENADSFRLKITLHLNVLAVATFIPAVYEFGDIGVDNCSFWWAMLFGGTFFGNLTLIGSTANIVAIGMLERRKRGNISLKE